MGVRVKEEGADRGPVNPFSPRGSPLMSKIVGQSKIKKGRFGWSGRLKKKDGKIGPVNRFPPRGSPLTSKMIWLPNSGIRQSQITKGWFWPV